MTFDDWLKKFREAIDRMIIEAIQDEPVKRKIQEPPVKGSISMGDARRAARKIKNDKERKI